MLNVKYVDKTHENDLRKLARWHIILIHLGVLVEWFIFNNLNPLASLFPRLFLACLCHHVQLCKIIWIRFKTKKI